MVSLRFLPVSAVGLQAVAAFQQLAADDRRARLGVLDTSRSARPIPSGWVGDLLETMSLVFHLLKNPVFTYPCWF